MALFRRRSREDDDAAVVSAARDSLARRGVEAVVVDAGTDDVRLEADGAAYPLFNLLIATRPLGRRERAAALEGWIDSLIAAQSGPDLAAMSEPELRERIRTRLLPDAPEARLPTAGYQRMLGPGLAVTLCLDFPTTVMLLTDENVAGLPLPLDELFRQGAANTAREPIDTHEEIAPGVWLVQGDSLFTASKIADTPAFVRDVVGAAPHGLVFGVPFRGALLYWAVDAELPALNALLSVTHRMARGDYGQLPGGVIDDGVWFWRDGGYQRVGHAEGDGLAVTVEGAFATALDEAASQAG